MRGTYGGWRYGLEGDRLAKTEGSGPEDPQTDRWEAGWMKEDGKPVMAGKTGQTQRSTGRRAEEMMGV